MRPTPLEISTLRLEEPGGRRHPLRRTLRVSCWPPLPHSRAGAGGDCLQASAAGGFGLPTPAEWTHPLGVILAAITSPRLRAEKYLRPPVARASRPPSAGSDTRRCSCLRAGRLTRTRWVFYWQPLPDKPIPYQRKPCLPRAPGKSCSKAIHAFERFSPLSAARGAARHPKRAAYTLKRVLFFLTALRLFSSSPLGRDPKRSLRSPAASVVNRKNQRNLSTHPGGMLHR